jgi:uncharacterized protein (TIGR02266 family)
MAGDKRRSPRREAELALRLAFGSVEEFVSRYARNTSRGGIFVQTRDPMPVGTPLTLEIEFESGEPIVQGKGIVVWLTAPSAPGETGRVPGMGILEMVDTPESLREKLQMPSAPVAPLGARPLEPSRS